MSKYEARHIGTAKSLKPFLQTNVGSNHNIDAQTPDRYQANNVCTVHYYHTASCLQLTGGVTVLVIHDIINVVCVLIIMEHRLV